MLCKMLDINQAQATKHMKYIHQSIIKKHSIIIFRFMRWNYISINVWCFIRMHINKSFNYHGAPIISRCIITLVFRMIIQKINQKFHSLLRIDGNKDFYICNSTYHHFFISKENIPLIFLLSHFFDQLFVFLFQNDLFQVIRLWYFICAMFYWFNNITRNVFILHKFKI